MKRVAILGIGARGADWAARFRLMGIDVALVDPLPDAKFRAEAACTAARAALPALYDVALPPEGRLVEFDRIDHALLGAACVVEAVPDTEADKRAVFELVRDALPEMRILSTAREMPLAALRALAPADTLLGRLSAAEPIWLMPVAQTEGIEADDILAEIGMINGPAEMADAVLELTDWDLDASVAALRSLKARGIGPGKALAEHEARIAPRAPEDLSMPPVTVMRHVPPDWVDYNGHMNEARYLTAFSDATDRLLLWAGMDADCIAQGHSVFTVETHIRHLGEVDIGDQIEVRTRVIDGQGKRLHVWHEMTRRGELSATAEQLLLHMDLKTRKVSLPRADVGAWLEAVGEAHADLPLPEGMGRFVGAPRD